MTTLICTLKGWYMVPDIIWTPDLGYVERKRRKLTRSFNIERMKGNKCVKGIPGKDFGSGENARKMYGRFMEREVGSDTDARRWRGVLIVGLAEDYGYAQKTNGVGHLGG